MNRKQFLLLVVALALAGAAGIAAWALVFRPVAVHIARVERDVAVQVFGLGTVEARVTSKVGFKVSGVLVELKADVGDRVAKGEVLARLDDREQRAQFARAKAAIEQTEASLQRAKASVEKAQANYDNATRISGRQQRLLQTNSASVEAAETAKTTQDAALADLNLANSDVLVAQANIGDAKAQQQQQSATLDFHTLVAPYDAMITVRLKELGSALGAGEPVFTLIDPKSVWVLAYIDESKAGEIHVGDSAQLVLRSLPRQRFPGRLPASSLKAIVSTKNGGWRSRSTAYPIASISASRQRSISGRRGSLRLCWSPKWRLRGSAREGEPSGPSRTGASRSRK